MEGGDFSEGNQKEGGQILLENTSFVSPKQKQLLKKQVEFELGEKERKVEELKEDKKKNKLEIVFTWFILFLVAIGLGLLAKWLLF